MLVKSEDVKAMRERTGYGLGTCKKIFRGDALRRLVSDATTLEEVKSALGEVLDDLYPRKD